jgi:hypothetical protein
MKTVNKQASQRRQEWQPHPASLEYRKLITVAIMWKAPLEGHSPKRNVNKQVGRRRQVWHHLPQCAWRESIQKQLKCGTLHWTMGKGHLPIEL